MTRFLLLLFSIFTVLLTHAQSLKLTSISLAGSKDKLPMWLWANQLGRYEQTNNYIQNFELEGAYVSSSKSDFKWFGGARVNAFLQENSAFTLSELYGGLNWKKVQLKVGKFPEPTKYKGLSTSNGNLSYSQNARPHPRIRIGFNDYLQIIPEWLAIYGVYEEGLLNDERYVRDTHLHHKSFYMRLGTPQSIQLSGGLEHYLMWGGTHPEYGALPGWEDYCKYVTGQHGGSNALETEQENALGNSYGSYQIDIQKHWTKLHLSLYISHPYEDRSGIEWENWKDNLIGLYFDFQGEDLLLGSLLLEYIHTKHQSGIHHLVLQEDGTYSGRGRDDYYNHPYYLSGVSYHQKSMGTPLFSPLILNDGISQGFENNRISGWHLAALGHIKEGLQWKTLLTFTQNYGVYLWAGASSYTPHKSQFSSLFQLNWTMKRLPLLLSASFSADKGELFDVENTTRIGAMLGLQFTLF